MLRTKRLPLAAGIVALWLLGGMFSSFGAGTRHLLHGHVPAVVARLTALGFFPATNQVRLAIGLPLRNTNELDELLRQIYNPASPNFRKYLTPEEFTAQFGPTESDYAAVRNFAQTNGFAVTATHGNRLLLDVTGSEAAVEKAFQVRLRVYRHPKEARDFFAPDSEPSVPENLPVADISGLDNYSRPHPKLVRQSLTVSPHVGSAPTGGYLGNDFRAAYVPGTALDGSGQMVGLLQFDGFYSNDIVAYANLANRTNIPPIQTVLIDGFSGTPTTGPNSGNPEVSLDIEMAMAMAPALAKIILFEGNPNNLIPNDVLNTMAASNTVKNLSSSWGWSGGPTTTTDNIFKNMAAQGQTFFNASGDSDAFPAGFVDDPNQTTTPSSSPYITQVGGTTLNTSGAGGNYATENVWNRGGGVGAGGGVSTYYSIPSWQLGISSSLINGGSTTARNIPDVALIAENVYVSYGNGGSGNFGGTSCAAPLWAGFMALVNQQAVAGGKPVVGFINPAVYEIANESIYNSVFHDTTSGNNASPASPNGFFAVSGYDLCTGVGTPNGTNLMNALLNPDPLIVVSSGGFNAVGSPGGTFNIASQNFYLTNAGTVPLAWSLLNTSMWLNVSAGSGMLAAGASSPVAVSLNTVASNLNAGTYSASLWFSNVTSGVAHARFFTLKVSDPLVILPTNNFFFSGPVGGPFAPASQGIALTNARAGTLNWSINNTSAWFNVSPASGSVASGARAAVTVTTTTAAASLPNGSYNAVFQVTNLASQFVQMITGNVVSGGLLVQNGGFETGDFTGWTQSGNPNYTIVTSGNATYVHSGTFGAALGPPGSLGFISQTLPTSPGQLYLLTFWLSNPTAAPTEQFQTSWNGVVIANLLNPGVLGWTKYNYLVTATGNSTVLQFGFRNDPAYFGLDDISVIPVSLPAITDQPTNLMVLAGNTAMFSASASGSPPLAYQWLKGGVNLANGAGISGATVGSLTLAGVTTNNAGNYSLVVTNAYGSVTSSVAVLTVELPPTITVSLTNQTIECGGNAGFAIAAAGTAPMEYHWSLDGSPISGATNNSLALAGIHLPSHTVAVAVTSLYGSATNSAVLTVHDTVAPVITLNGPNPISIELGGTFSDPGATANDICAGGVAVMVSGTINLNAVGTNLLAYSSTDGNANTSTVTRIVIVRDTTPPTILWSFTNLVLAANTNCSAVMPDVTGTNFILATDMSGTLTISQNPTNNSVLALGTNQIVITVTDASGNAAYSTNTITVQDETSPVIVSQPQNLTNVIGTSATFNIAATACTTSACQWFFNSMAVAGQTNSSLAIDPVNLTNAGNYFAIVTASGGSVTSVVAVLTVLTLPPAITGVAANPDGSFTLNLAGTSGETYVLETTTNLVLITGWQPIATNMPDTNGVWQFNDVEATNFAQRFYRLKLVQ